MPRFFMTANNFSGKSFTITGADAEHIRVLRMRLGERLVICDGNGVDHKCRIVTIGSDFAEAEVEETIPCPAEPSVKVSILAGMPKGERADFIVQKCTEAGASQIAFFISERSVSRPDGKSAEKKRIRWQRIAEEAAKQSGRGIIPEVLVLPSLADALDIAMQTELPLLMYETGERLPLREALEDKEYKSAAIITGPEGGFEQFEVDLAAAIGIRACEMGPRILRCETAPLCALTAMMYATGNM